MEVPAAREGGFERVLCWGLAIFEGGTRVRSESEDEKSSSRVKDTMSMSE